MANLYIIDAEVLGEIKDGYRLKVSLVDLGLYMFGVRATRSDREESGWWVQPPAVPTKSGWKPSPEFDRSKDLWIEITQKCIDSIELYQDGSGVNYAPTEDDMTEGGFDRAFGIGIDDNKRPDPYSPVSSIS